MFEYSFSRKKETILHVIFWMVMLIFNIIYIPTNKEYQFTIKEMGTFFWTGNITFIITFYFNYLLVLPRILKEFSWLKLILGLLSTYFVFAVTRGFLEQFLVPLILNEQNYPKGTTVIFFFFDNIFWSLRAIFFSTAFGTIVHFIRLSEYNSYVLNENKNAEIKFLKAQTNPHFVFNTLNNIYSMVYRKSEEALPAIEKMSKIMKFTTYETRKEKIKLSEEIDYIQSYIDLESFRHKINSFVKFRTSIANSDLEIPPYILSPLVENAVKHGLISDTHPIEIDLKTTPQNLSFRVSNKIGKKKKDSLGGIGLENLKKRLAIAYPQNHNLTTTEKNGEFIATIEIELP